LRDPVAREISSFNHHYQKGFLNGDESLLCRMVEQRVILDNPQVRMLSGPEGMVGPCTEETYHRAANNLSLYFSLVGIVERANEFIQAMLAMHGWPTVAYPRAQISAIKAIEEPSDEVRQMLSDFHALDRRLYAYAGDKWREWMAQNVEGQLQLDASDPVIYLPPDIHQTKQPRLIPASQLEYVKG
jgi:hypothetical protein